MERKLTMHIPAEIAEALSRRHKGRELAVLSRIALVQKMEQLWKEHQALTAKLTWLLDVYWEEKRIEANFGRPIFYGAHRRLRNLRTKKEQTHRDMFYVLLNADGNYEPFSPTDSMYAEDIYHDFTGKYNKNPQQK